MDIVLVVKRSWKNYPPNLIPKKKKKTKRKSVFLWTQQRKHSSGEDAGKA